jgi:DNA-directed RNA polymerase subunit N (RpoN/RPB10)
MSETYFYSIIHPKCSCRQKNGDLRNIGRLYRTYYTRLSSGESSVEILNNIDDEDGEYGLPRMCCRSRFMSIPVVPMIDRSQDRIYDDRKAEIVTSNTPKIEPGYDPLEFPILDGTKALKVIPPKVNVKGKLPGGF